jgi:phosphate transport system protein
LCVMGVPGPAEGGPGGPAGRPTPPEPVVPKHLQKDLDHLHKSVLTLAGYVEDAVATATAALQNRDPDLARRVVDGDDAIDRMENAVQDECLKILALHQPVAVDLRRISAVLMITTDLERIGDLAAGIAERAAILARPPYLPIPEQFGRMTDRALSMLRASLNAFVNLDADAACRVIRADDEVDRDNEDIIRALVAEMKRSPDLVEPGLSLFSAVRHLERIADHATNIAEDVIYLVNGDIVRHHPEALPTPG